MYDGSMRVDPDIVAAARDGAPAGFEAIVRAYGAGLYALCLASTRSPEEAADAVQEVFLKVLLGLRGLRDPRRFEQWLFAIARNECASRGRFRGREMGMRAPDVEPDALPAADRGTVHETAVLGSLFSVLSPEQAEVVALRYGAELTVNQAALACGVTRAVAKSRLHEAMTRMRKAAPRLNARDALSGFRIPVGMEETIMENAALLRLGAGVIERLAIYDQRRLAILARKGEKLDEALLEAMGRIEGGTELVRRTGARMDVRELGMFLNYGDPYTEKRIVEELEAADPATAEALKARMFVFGDFVLFDRPALAAVIAETGVELFAHGLSGLGARERKEIMAILEASVHAQAADLLTRLPETPEVARAAQSEVVAHAYRMDKEGLLETVRGKEAGPRGCIVRLARR
jgi:RNA polymerase sigma factor (sigma-70 family)